MLIDFSVENFRSFGEEQTLNLLAIKSQKGHEDHAIDIADSGERVLRVGVIYGANGAGKSNLVRAIEFAQRLIVRGVVRASRIATSGFRFSSNPSQPSAFEFRYLVGDRIFVYGFEVTPDEVVEEWLSATNEHGRESDVFHRSRGDILIGDLKKFDAAGATSETSLQALKELGTRPEQLLFSKIVDLGADRRGELLDSAAAWFTDCLTVVTPDSSFAPRLEHLACDDDFRRFAGQFLASVGTGVGGLKVEQSEQSDDKLPKPLVEALQKAGDEAVLVALGPGMSLQLKPGNPATVIRRNLVARHAVSGSDFSLPFAEESEGTQRLLNLLPALYELRNRPKVFVIDELDRSLHPQLSYEFLRFFVEACPGARRQLIVTTHETHLLDVDLLRRDEIWFAEKDERQQTRLVSLADMNVRNDLRLEKSYLHGRFGGVPLIRGTEQLQECAPLTAPC